MNVQLALLWGLFVEGLVVIWEIIRLRGKLGVSAESMGSDSRREQPEKRMSVGT